MLTKRSINKGFRSFLSDVPERSHTPTGARAQGTTFYHFLAFLK